METLIVERNEGVVTVTMNRPERKNAINGVLQQELQTVFEEIERTEDDRVMVLTGAGGDFCSGADLSDVNGPVSDGSRHFLHSMRRSGDVALALHRMTTPTIAQVDGVAVGAGCSLALGCDLIVASDRARFSLIFTKRSLSLDYGSSWLLPRLVGLAKAKEIALFGGMWSGQEAVDIGLINRVLPLDQLKPFVVDWATTLSAGPPLALSMTKTLLLASAQATMEQAVEDEARCQAVNFYSKDTREAMMAFAEKRPASFIGR